MNISFDYCYRDGANYKKYGSEIFSNNSAMLLQEIETKITLALIDGEWFYADKWNLPDLHFDKWDSEIDHTWHEYQNVHETNQSPTSQNDITSFLAMIIN